MSTFQDVLRQNAAFIGSLSAVELSCLENHCEMLQRWNQRLNLTALHKIVEIAERHYCESIWLARRIGNDSRSVADIGAGAGFPGFPIGALYSNCRVTLVESHSRKCVFLRESTRGYSNLRVLEGRADQLTGVFDWLVSRAVRFDVVLGAARSVGGRVGLLIGGADCEAATQANDFWWSAPEPLPWGDRRFFLAGELKDKR